MYRMIVAIVIALAFIGSVNAQSAPAQDTITINRWNTIFEDATGGVKFSHNGNLMYGMFECTDVTTLDGVYPIFNAAYDGADLLSFNITTDDDVTCTIDADHRDDTTIYTLRLTLTSADDLESLSSYSDFTYDSNAGYYTMTGTSADVAYVASLYSVSDLYIFRAQYVYIPMVAGN